MGYRDEHRQLAAIMFTDIVGFTALMSASEASALRVLKRSRRLVRRLTRRYKGRWLETVGDDNLISFASATDAVNCALAIQQNLHKDADLRLRIGIHVGDVIDAGGHIYGDGVNVASRIHELAEPGGIVVSEPVYDAVRNKAGINTEKLGVRDLEGLDHPIQAYALGGEAVDSPLLGRIDLPDKQRWGLALVLVVIAVAGVLSTGLYSRYADVRAGDTSVAVLPFEDLSPDASNRYFSEGISAELINSLARVPGLRVAGRSSSFAVGMNEQDARRIGEKLNVSHILDGSVRKADDRVRISAQLVETENGFQLWADTYEAQLDNIFDVQQNISRSIVEALRPELMPEELAAIGRVGTADVKAYDLYLQARSALRDADSAKDFDDALELVDKSLRRDPMFAEAEAAKCEVLVGNYRQTRQSDLMPEAVDVCNRALTMDPESALAHIALGNLHLTAGRPAFAIEYLAKALPLDPDNADLYVDLGAALTTIGRVDDAVQSFERALELTTEPASVYRTYGTYMAMAGQLEKSADLLRQSIGLNPNGARAHANLGGVLYFLGRFEEARVVLEKAVEMDPTNDRAFNNLGAILFYTHDFEGSLQMLQRAQELTPNDARFMGGLADACRYVESCDKSDAYYRKALELAEERLRVNPDDAHEMILKAIYQYHLGNPEEGRRMAEQAVELAPDNRTVIFNAAIFWSQYGNREKAKEYVARARMLGYPESELSAHPDIVAVNRKKDQ